MEAYRIVKRLADSGIVVATPGNPVKYTGKPIEQVVAMMMDRQMKKLEEMERGRDEVISLGRTVPAPTRPDEKYSFRMIQGREQIYSQVLRIIDSVKSSIDIVLTRNDLAQLHLLGLSDRIKGAQKRGVRSRIISVADYQTTEAAEALSRIAEVRHSDDFPNGRIVIGDEDHILISLVLDDVTGKRNERDVAIWTDGRDYAETMRQMFEKAFATSTELKAKLYELQKGRKVAERTKAIVDIIKASLPLEGWRVEAPGHVSGVSGTDYELPVLVTLKDRVFAVDIVMGNDEDALRDAIISGIMKGIDVKKARLVVIAAPYSGEELQKLANLVGVGLLSGADPVAAVTKLRKAISG